MTIDVATLTALRREIADTLVGGRIQRVLHPGNLAVAFEVYARGATWWLVIDAAPQAPHCYLTRERPARASDNVTPLLLLLRKYARNGRLMAVAQPPWERVLQFTLHARVDDEIVETTLIAEIMGRTSNLVLVDDGGAILESLKRVDAAINRYRQVLPRLPYVPPPPLARPDPFAAQASVLAAAAQSEKKQPAWRLLMGQTSGIGPLLAREAVFRAAGAAETPAADANWPDVLGAARDVFAQVADGELTPCVARDADGALAAYAPYALTIFPQCEPCVSMSAAIETFYQEQGKAPPRHQKQDLGQKPLAAALQERMKQLTQRRRALERQRDEAADAEEWRRKGDLVLAYGYSAAPGSAEIQADGETIRIDPQVSVPANAETYFDTYKRKKRAQAEVPGLLRRVANEQAYCEQAEALLEAAETPTDVRALRDELRDLGILGGGQDGKSKKSQGKRGKGKRGKTADDGAQPVSAWLDGVQVLVGRSGAQNDAALRLADADDLWLHARNVPGAHTVLRSGGRDLPDEIIHQAAQIAAYYSKLRASASAEVDVTRRRYVRRIPGAPPGLVTYRNEYTIRVKPAPIPQPDR